MTKYLALPHNKKLNLLREHSFSCDWPNLEHKNWCLHCGQSFDGHSVRVWQAKDGSLWLECGTADCDGSPIDWAPFPWWDPKHPETKARKKKGRSRRGRGGRGADAGEPPF
jgi:hypothetical protein